MNWSFQFSLQFREHKILLDYLYAVQQVFSPGQRIQIRGGIGATLNSHRTSSECSSPLSVAMRTSPASTPPPPTTSYSPLVVAAVSQQFGTTSASSAAATCEQTAVLPTSCSLSAASTGIISSSLSSTCSSSSSAFSTRPPSVGVGCDAAAPALQQVVMLQWPPKSPVQSPVQSPSRAHPPPSSQQQLFRRSLLASKRKSKSVSDYLQCHRFVRTIFSSI